MKLNIIFSTFFSLILLNSCSLMGDHLNDLGYKSSGKILLSGSIDDPSLKVSSLSFENDIQLYGFSNKLKSFKHAVNENWILLNSATGELSIKRGDSTLATFHGAVISLPSKGRSIIYSPTIDPIWRATDDYFTRRGLAVPAEEDPSRLRRGALGTIAIEITPGFYLHDATVSTPDVGGIVFKTEEIKEISSILKPGTDFIIR